MAPKVRAAERVCNLFRLNAAIQRMKGLFEVMGDLPVNESIRLFEADAFYKYKGIDQNSLILNNHTSQSPLETPTSPVLLLMV